MKSADAWASRSIVSVSLALGKPIEVSSAVVICATVGSPPIR